MKLSFVAVKLSWGKVPVINLQIRMLLEHTFHYSPSWQLISPSMGCHFFFPWLNAVVDIQHSGLCTELVNNRHHHKGFLTFIFPPNVNHDLCTRVIRVNWYPYHWPPARLCLLFVCVNELLDMIDCSIPAANGYKQLRKVYSDLLRGRTANICGRKNHGWKSAVNWKIRFRHSIISSL
jgi:hypothetical protein